MVGGLERGDGTSDRFVTISGWLFDRETPYQYRNKNKNKNILYQQDFIFYFI